MTINPQMDFFGWARMVGVQITNAPVFYSDEVPRVSGLGILCAVYIVK
jgi:hypothetical protein